jgi:hypothetical protein
VRSVFLRLGLLVAVALEPHSAFAQPSISEISHYITKMTAFQQDLIDLGKYSKGSNTDAAIGLIDVAAEYWTALDHLKDLLFIVTLIKNNDDRNIVKAVVDERMKHIVKGIDLSLKRVNLEISRAQSNAVVSTGNQMKMELRRLKVLLSPMKISP